MAGSSRPSSACPRRFLPQLSLRSPNKRPGQSPGTFGVMTAHPVRLTDNECEQSLDRYRAAVGVIRDERLSFKYCVGARAWVGQIISGELQFEMQ